MLAIRIEGVEDRFLRRGGRRIAGHDHRPESGRLVLGVVVDIKVEIHPDPFKEIVRKRYEADFNGHLQILHAAQLFQKVHYFFVNVLSLADHDAEVGFERRIEPGPPTLSQVCGFTVPVIKLIRLSKSACVPPPNPPGPNPIGCCD